MVGIIYPLIGLSLTDLPKTANPPLATDLTIVIDNFSEEFLTSKVDSFE